MSVQEIEQTIPTLDVATLRRIKKLVDAQLCAGDRSGPVPYELIAHLEGVFSDAPADLSSNKRHLQGLGQRSIV